MCNILVFCFSSRRRHTRWTGDWSSDVCSSDLTAAAVQLAFSPARRRELLWFVPVGVAVAAWYVAFGRFGEHPNPPPTAANLLLDPLYALWGLSQSAVGLIGLGGWVGVPVLAIAAAVIAWRWVRRRPDSFGEIGRASCRK